MFAGQPVYAEEEDQRPQAANIECAEQELNTEERVVPVTEEPLHIVRYRSERFTIYTNRIKPGVRTLYHTHQNDLLAVIVLDTTVTSQAAGDAPRTQTATAGSVAFFPYADSPTPYAHRVGALVLFDAC
jgi:hypothetical protein